MADQIELIVFVSGLLSARVTSRRAEARFDLCLCVNFLNDGE
jgi:hypothetical protein